MIMTPSIRKRGFTLIELLVVIAIIAVLIALLLARRSVSARGRAPGPVHQQHEAARARHAQLPSDEQHLPDRQHSPAGSYPCPRGWDLRDEHLRRLPEHPVVLPDAALHRARECSPTASTSSWALKARRIPCPWASSPTARSAGTKISTFQCPSDRDNKFQITPQYAGGLLSGPVFTKGNYGVSWGNTFWGQDDPPVSSFPVPMIDPVTKLPPVFMKSAFGHYTIGMQAVTDGSSNTGFMAEVLQGELYDVRGLMWSTIPGGGSFFSRMPPNNPVDYYQTGIFGDFLNQPIFCVNEPGMDLPCTGLAGDQPAFAGARSRHPGGINVLNGDGSVRFIKNSINMPIWLGLNTISGGEVISADAY